MSLRWAGLTRTGSSFADLTFLRRALDIDFDDPAIDDYVANLSAQTLRSGDSRGVREMVEFVHASRARIREQNQRLHELASRDSLTACLNRRAFFARAEAMWNDNLQRGMPMGGIMVDVDNLSSINTRNGQEAGDLALQHLAELMIDIVGDRGIVGRYSGEEFCVLLGDCDLEQSVRVAEQIRTSIANQCFETVRITVSVGVTASRDGIDSAQQLMEEADRCLAHSRRDGGNRVYRSDQMPAEASGAHVASPGPSPFAERFSGESQIPYHAVASLLSALTYRDPDTAAHASRVADLCVAAARGRMSLSELYILEVAALLHDIGKIGVPDAILLKPGKLTDEEWRVMDLHARIGADIVAASFRCEKLIEIVRNHHARYSGESSVSGLPHGKEIPLGARIVSIADAYDAMVSDRVYRKGRSPQEAFEELRRHAGTQFDPELVEHFIAVVGHKHRAPSPTHRHCRELALHLGVHMEQLVRALDENDFGSVAVLAAHVEATAAKFDVHDVAEKARQLRSRDIEDRDLGRLFEDACDLLDLCSSAQRAHLEVSPEASEVDAVRRGIFAPG